MIGTILRVEWTNLKRDRAALFLTFVLPLGFFAIFAAIFGNLGTGGEGGPKALAVLAVDRDGSTISSDLIAALAAQEGLTVSRAPRATDDVPEPPPWDRESAFRAVRGGEAAAAVVVPEGFGRRYGDFGSPGAAIELIYDASNPMARYTVGGLLQAAAFQAAPTVLVERGFQMLQDYGGGDMTGEQVEALGNLRGLIDQAGGGAAAVQADGPGALIAVEATAAHDDEGEGDFSMVAYYAAGIGVMFLLFSMSGAAGTLLDDQESGVLERLLSSNLTTERLLAGKWLFYALVGVAQIVLMFLLGAFAFGLELFVAKRLAGFGVMTLVTCAAASAFGMLLATLCTSRAQLGGVSTIVILVMSALGGSMVPRFVMPDFMDALSKLTFNGWALDGFLKVFWYADPQVGVLGGLWSLAPQVAVLASVTFVFLWLARRFARRWERV
jgi:ABC-2 type transport system permease protein